MKRHLYENKYCTGCQQTVRHEVKETSFSCLRCGVIKYPAKTFLAQKQLGVVQTPMNVAC